MALYKNVAGQKVAVFAWDTANSTEKTGDAGNITAQISKDGGATAASNDANPTELDATDAPGVYIFDLTQAESNADLFVLFAKSSTADIKIEPVVIYTMPGDSAAISADVTEVSGDSTAADNLELDYDGTGYDKTNSIIGTTTTNTDMRGTDGAITTSTTADTGFTIAQALKRCLAILDGTVDNRTGTTITDGTEFKDKDGGVETTHTLDANGNRTVS